MSVAEQMEEQKQVVRATRTVAARRKERKVMADLSAELRANLVEIAKLEPFKAKASASNVLARISDATLKLVLQDLGANSLSDVEHYAGPMERRIETTDHLLGPQAQTGCDLGKYVICNAIASS